MHPMLNIAVKAARRAGSIITRASEDIGVLTVNDKGYNDFVSEVDLASEKTIIEVLSKAYPGHAFLGEESGLSGDGENVWIIDFDKCYQQKGDEWKENNLSRLTRSFHKEVNKRHIHWSEDEWHYLLEGYNTI